MIILRNILAIVVIAPVLACFVGLLIVVFFKAPTVLIFLGWLVCALILIAVQLHVEEKARNG